MSLTAANALPPSDAHEDVSSLGGAIWRRKFWVIIPTLLAFFGSLLAVSLLPVRYSGEARVLLENRETVYSRPERETRTDPAIDPEAVASQVQIVMSKDLALKVIRDLDLANKAEFDPIAKGLGVTARLGMLTGLMPDPRDVPLEERVVQSYYKRLLVFPQGKSRVIAIEFQSEDPQLAALVANRIAEEYLSREERAKRDTSKVSSDWLDKAIEPLMKKVVESEAKVEAFRAARGLFIGSNNMTITNQQLAELNSQLGTARAQQADLASRAKIIREALRLGRVFETSEVNNNELVRRLLEQRAALKAQIAFDERTLLPGHPRMQELNSQLRDLETQVRAAAERAARALENDARAAGARLESVQAEMAKQKKSAALSNEDEVQLKALEREATALREQLNSYRNKFLDAAARSGDSIAPADGRVISRAFPQNEPTFPKKVPIVLLATLGTLVISLALISSMHLMAKASAMPYPELGFSNPMSAHAMPMNHAPMSPSFAPRQDVFEDPDPIPPKSAKRGGLTSYFTKAQDRAMLAISPSGEGERLPAGAAPIGPMPAPEQDVRVFQGVTPRGAAGSKNAGAIADEIAAEMAVMGYLGRGKVLMLFGHGRDARTSIHAMRLGRRFSQDGASVLIDLCGLSELYPRAVGVESLGLGDYLDGECELSEIIHRDARSRLHLVPAGEQIAPLLAGETTLAGVNSLLDALMQSYAFVVIDAGPIGSASEALCEFADAFALLTAQPTEDSYLSAAASRFESLRGSPVFIIEDDAPLFEQPGGQRLA
ncbi:eps_transp_fam, exopolysaccharide transport protein family [Rhabdaerophilaceae bacterium]